MSRLSWLALAAAVLSGSAAAQQPSAGGVKPSATIEVIEDPSQVDDVISRLQHQREATPTAQDPSLRDGQRVAGPGDELKAERPDVPGDVPNKDSEKDRDRKTRKDERRSKEHIERVRRSR